MSNGDRDQLIICFKVDSCHFKSYFEREHSSFWWRFELISKLNFYMNDRPLYEYTQVSGRPFSMSTQPKTISCFQIEILSLSSSQVRNRYRIQSQNRRWNPRSSLSHRKSYSDLYLIVQTRVCL